jgi:hypothetical protein
MNNIDSFDNANGDSMEMWSKVASQLTGVPAPDSFENTVLLKTALGSLPSVETSLTASAESMSFESAVMQKAALSKLERVQAPENFEADVLLKIRQTAPKPATGAFPFKNIAYLLLPLLFVGAFFALQPSAENIEPKQTVSTEKNVVPPAVIPPADSTNSTVKADTAKAEPVKSTKKKRKAKKDEWTPTRGTRP